MIYCNLTLVPPGLLVRAHTCWLDVGGLTQERNIDLLAAGGPAWGVTTTSATMTTDFVAVEWLDPRGSWGSSYNGLEALPGALEWSHDQFTIYREGEEPDEGLAVLAAWRLTHG